MIYVYNCYSKFSNSRWCNYHAHYITPRIASIRQRHKAIVLGNGVRRCASGDTLASEAYYLRRGSRNDSHRRNDHVGGDEAVGFNINKIFHNNSLRKHTIVSNVASEPNYCCFDEASLTNEVEGTDCNRDVLALRIFSSDHHWGANHSIFTNK